jgi:hypothetical protein
VYEVKRKRDRFANGQAWMRNSRKPKLRGDGLPGDGELCLAAGMDDDLANRWMSAPWSRHWRRGFTRKYWFRMTQ